jgi:hypothetical protein
LLDDPDERQQLGQLARARAQHYTPEHLPRGMADIYARVAQLNVGAQAIAGLA